MDIRQLRIIISKRQVTNEISPVVAPDNYLAVRQRQQTPYTEELTVWEDPNY